MVWVCWCACAERRRSRPWPVPGRGMTRVWVLVSQMKHHPKRWQFWQAGVFPAASPEVFGAVKAVRAGVLGSSFLLAGFVHGIVIALVVSAGGAHVV